VDIVAISGSLRAHSSNLALLQAAVRVAPAGVRIFPYDGLGRLPHFNPDLDQEGGAELRRSLIAAEGTDDASLANLASAIAALVRAVTLRER
jgi:NAD(P)H-dependent FMN reductase